MSELAETTKKDIRRLREQIAAVSAYERIATQVERELAVLAALEEALAIPAAREAVAHYEDELREAVETLNAYADAVALWDDWYAVGDDMRAAIKNYEKSADNQRQVPAGASDD